MEMIFVEDRNPLSIIEPWEEYDLEKMGKRDLYMMAQGFLSATLLYRGHSLKPLDMIGDMILYGEIKQERWTQLLHILVDVFEKQNAEVHPLFPQTPVEATLALWKHYKKLSQSFQPSKLAVSHLSLEKELYDLFHRFLSHHNHTEQQGPKLEDEEQGC